MDKPLNIPHDMSSATLKKNVDSVTITVTADCTWCYDDPDNCFGNGFLAPGYYTATTPHTSYGPYTPSNTGSVGIGSVTGNNPCSATQNPTATMKSITVNN
jgi:hypothetical protein